MNTETCSGVNVFFFADYMCFVCRLAGFDQVTNNGFLVRSWFVDFTLDIENNHNRFHMSI